MDMLLHVLHILFEFSWAAHKIVAPQRVSSASLPAHCGRPTTGVHWEVGRRILHKKLISGVVAHALRILWWNVSLLIGLLSQSKNKMAEVTGWGWVGGGGGNCSKGGLQIYVNN